MQVRAGKREKKKKMGDKYAAMIGQPRNSCCTEKICKEKTWLKIKDY